MAFSREDFSLRSKSELLDYIEQQSEQVSRLETRFRGRPSDLCIAQQPLCHHACWYSALSELSSSSFAILSPSLFLLFVPFTDLALAMTCNVHVHVHFPPYPFRPSCHTFSSLLHRSLHPSLFTLSFLSSHPHMVTDVVRAYRGIIKEKEALEASLKALSEGGRGGGDGVCGESGDSGVERSSEGAVREGGEEVEEGGEEGA